MSREAPTRNTRPLALGCAPGEGGAGGGGAIAAVAGADAGGAMPGIGATSFDEDFPAGVAGSGGGSGAALALAPLLGPKLRESMSCGSTGSVKLRPSFR